MANDSEDTQTQITGYIEQDRPNLLERVRQYWTPLDGRQVFVGCGDDRPPTAESAIALAQANPEAMSPSEGYASVFGALAGMAKNAIVAAHAQGNQAFLDHAKEQGFIGLMEELRRASDNVLTLHTAEGNEGGPATFNPESTKDVGCAYAMGVGATSDMVAGPSSELIASVAREDQKRIFGSDEHFDALRAGHTYFEDEFTDGKRADFVVGRQTYRQMMEDGLQTMVLQGSHVPCEKSAVISSFYLDRVGNPTAAHQAGNDVYRLEIAIVTRDIMRAFAAYRLDPELLMRAFQLDATPVRAVLNAHDPQSDGTLDPRKLPTGFIGGARQAITQLQAELAA